jgi:hypothetical protein
VSGPYRRRSPRIGGHMCGDMRGARGGAPRSRPVAGPVIVPAELQSTSSWVFPSLGGVR